MSGCDSYFVGACYIDLYFAHADLLLCTTSRRFHPTLQSPVPVLILLFFFPSSFSSRRYHLYSNVTLWFQASRARHTCHWSLQLRSLPGSEETSTEHVSMASLLLQHVAHDSRSIKRPWLKYKYPPLVSTCMCLYMHAWTWTHLHMMWNVLLYASSKYFFYWLMNMLFWSMVGQNITTWEIQTEIQREGR